jgi:hypothetical protein
MLFLKSGYRLLLSAYGRPILYKCSNCRTVKFITWMSNIYFAIRSLEAKETRESRREGRSEASATEDEEYGEWRLVAFMTHKLL